MHLNNMKRNRIIEDHLKLVDPIAGHYAKCSGLDRDDLRQVGRLGLLRAARGYEQTRQRSFAVYAKPHIRGAILHYLRDNVGLIRLPRRLQEQAQATIKTTNVEADRAQPLSAEMEFKLHTYRCRRGWEPLDESRQVSQQTSWQPLLEKECSRRLWTAINRLVPEERKALVSVVLEGSSLRAAGRGQGVSAMTMQRRLKRALAQLRKELGDQVS